MNTEISTTIEARPAGNTTTGLRLNTFDEMKSFALAVHKSGLAPKGIQTPEAIVVALQLGAEVGLSPMASLQNIAVINGRPSLWGDAMLAVCRNTGQLEAFDEWFEVDGKRIERNPATFTDETACVCRVKRRGYSATETAFSVRDAKAAKLWGKAGPWTEYPARMLKARARSFALRDQFGDALRGLLSTEELRDIPAEPRRTTGRVVEPPPAAAPAMSPERKAMLADLRSAYQEAGVADGTAAEAMLRSAGLLQDGQHVSDLADDELAAAWTVRFEVFPPTDV